MEGYKESAWTVSNDEALAQLEAQHAELFGDSQEDWGEFSELYILTPFVCVV